MRSDDDSGSGRDVGDTTDLDHGHACSFEDDLHHDLEDILCVSLTELSFSCFYYLLFFKKANTIV